METGLKRTNLYASASSPANMAQVGFYEADCIVYDLEDSVSLAEKDAARLLVYHTVRYHRPKGKYILIRVNGLYSEFFEEDLQAAVRARPNAIRVPKIESAKEVQNISARITAIEERAGITVGTTKLWCIIESYLGVLYAREIAQSDPRVVALSIGAEDFTASMGAQRTRQSMEVFYTRNTVLLACREAGIAAIDTVFTDINDADGLREDVEVGKILGFDGKTVVHPRQIETVNAAFAPSQKEINYAMRVLDTLQEGVRQHKGVITLDGSMLDKPMELRARRTLRLAQAAGAKVGKEYLDD